jgi:hypothetical protein
MTRPSSASEHDLELKLRIMRYLWSLGYFVRRNVPVMGGEGAPYTDIDVLGLKLNEELDADFVVCDCKSGLTDGTRERLFWLSGVMKYFGSARGIFLRTRMLPAKYVELADTLGIIPITDEQLAELEKTYSVKADKFIGPFCLEHSKAELRLSKLKESNRTIHDYIHNEYWKDQPHQQILSLMSKAKDLTQARALDEDERLFQLTYILSLLSLSIMRFARAILFVPSGQKEEVARLALLGGRTGYEERKALLQGFYDFMTREIEERFRAKYPIARNQFIENVIPAYSKYLSDLTIRLCQNPRAAAVIPRVMDLLAYEKVLCSRTVLPEDVLGRSSVSVDDISRTAKDFLAFVQRSGLSSAYLDHTLEETLKDIESPVGLSSDSK